MQPPWSTCVLPSFWWKQALKHSLWHKQKETLAPPIWANQCMYRPLLTSLQSKRILTGSPGSFPPRIRKPKPVSFRQRKMSCSWQSGTKNTKKYQLWKCEKKMYAKSVKLHWRIILDSNYGTHLAAIDSVWLPFGLINTHPRSFVQLLINKACLLWIEGRAGSTAAPRLIEQERLPCVEPTNEDANSLAVTLSHSQSQMRALTDRLSQFPYKGRL